MLNLKLKGKQRGKLKRVNVRFEGFLLDEPVRDILALIETVLVEEEVCYNLMFSKEYTENDIFDVVVAFVNAFCRFNSLGAEETPVYTEGTKTGLPDGCVKKLMNHKPRVEKIELRITKRGKEFKLC